MKKKSKIKGKWIAAPLILVLVLAIIWSGFWIYASGRVSDEITKKLAELKSKGTEITCLDRSQAGYPFRIEVECKQPLIVAGRGEERFQITARRFQAVSQIYDPTLVIAEIKGPMIIESLENKLAPKVQLDWDTARASINFSIGDNTVNDLRVIIKTPHLGQTFPEANAGSQSVVSADTLEIYALRKTEQSNQLDDFDINIRSSLIQLPGAADKKPGSRLRLRSVDAVALLTAIQRQFTNSPKDNLRLWQANGGMLDIKSIRIESDEFTALSEGDLALNSAGQLNGELSLSLAKFKQDINSDRPKAVKGGVLSVLTSVISAIGSPSKIDDQDASKVGVQIDNGRISAGPLTLYTLKPLF